MRHQFILTALAVAGTLAHVHGQQPAARLEVSRLGPQVGQVVPDFRLQDGRGTAWTRDSIMGPKGAMIVFSRSADWCPYCKTQMIELQGRLPELKAQGLGLAVITYDAPAALADFSRRRGITYPLLSDPGSETIKAYGILNTTVAAGASTYGIPFPGTFLIDRSGRVTSRFFEEAYQERNTVSTMLIALGRAKTPATATNVETNQLVFTSYVSDDIVAPGSLLSVVFEVVPKKGTHVYAPGAKDYKVVAFRPNPSPILSIRPLQYPASEIYHFKPLDERVPVFQRPFRLVLPVSVSTAPEVRGALTGADTVTIAGTFEYQACDDRVCFTPQSIPVSHTVKLRQLDTERAVVPK